MAKRAIRSTLFFWLVMTLLSACKAGPPVISIDSPQAAVSPALLRVASVFMKIGNTGGSPDTLTSARVDLPDTITELHDIQDGKMVKVEGIAIPAGQIVVLRPARFHIMVLNLPKTIQEGSQIPLVLTFKKSGPIRLTLQLTKFEPAKLHN